MTSTCPSGNKCYKKSKEHIKKYHSQPWLWDIKKQYQREWIVNFFILSNQTETVKNIIGSMEFSEIDNHLSNMCAAREEQDTDDEDEYDEDNAEEPDKYLNKG